MSTRSVRITYRANKASGWVQGGGSVVDRGNDATLLFLISPSLINRWHFLRGCKKRHAQKYSNEIMN